MIKKTKALSMLFLLSVVLVSPAIVKADNSSNYATSTETLQFWYDG